VPRDVNSHIHRAAQVYDLAPGVQTQPTRRKPSLARSARQGFRPTSGNARQGPHRKARVPIFSPALATPHKQSSGSLSRRAPEKAAHTSLSLLERYPSKNAPAKRHQRTSAAQFCSSPQTSRDRDTETSTNSYMQPAVEHGQGTPKFARIRRAPRATTPPRSPERALQDVLR
jgi:hypothetical protein